MTFQSAYEAALDKSLEVREKCGLDFKAPAAIFDVCERLGLAVRLTNDVSMEGIYVGAGLNRPTIVISTLRPLSRRVFTCAHELGHHVFGDGVVLDEVPDGQRPAQRDAKELRADAFAGHFLMPMLGVAEAFTIRGWRPETAEAAQVYAVACNFGVGYTTLVHHMHLALRLISERQRTTLLQSGLPRIRRELLGLAVPGTLVVADRHYSSPTLDTEVGTLILLSQGCCADAGLEPEAGFGGGTTFRAMIPGVFRVFLPGTEWAILLRVSRQQYRGLARYRHLEDAEDDEPAAN